MINEHQPCYQNLERISNLTPAELILSKETGEWLRDPGLTHQLLKNITAYLISLNTNSYNGKDFAAAESFVIELFGSALRQGQLELHKFAAKNAPASPRNHLVFAPPKLTRQMNQLTSLYDTDETIQEIWIDNVIVHLHLDSVFLNYDKQGQVNLGSLAAYYDPKQDLLYGRKSVDMAGTAAVAALASAVLNSKGIENPVFVITTDEELQGMYGGLDLMKILQSKSLKIDLEPIADGAGTFCSEIAPSVSLTFPITHVTAPDIELLQSEFESRYSAETLLISYEEGRLSVSLNTEGFSESPLTTLGIMKGLTQSVFPGQNEEGIGINEKKVSQISGAGRKALRQSLINCFPFRQTNRVLSGITTSFKKGLLPQLFSRESIIAHNFLTMATLTGDHLKNVAILGTNEAGGRRHSSTEAVKIEELYYLLRTLVQVITKLHS